MQAENLLKPFENALYQVLDNLGQFAMNYIFGILALLFGIRFFSGLMTGRFSVITCALTVIFGFLAVTMGQTFWTQVPIFKELMKIF